MRFREEDPHPLTLVPGEEFGLLPVQSSWVFLEQGSSSNLLLYDLSSCLLEDPSQVQVHVVNDLESGEDLSRILVTASECSPWI